MFGKSRIVLDMLVRMRIRYVQSVTARAATNIQLTGLHILQFVIYVVNTIKAGGYWKIVMVKIMENGVVGLGVVNYETKLV